MSLSWHGGEVDVGYLWYEIGVRRAYVSCDYL